MMLCKAPSFKSIGSKRSYSEPATSRYGGPGRVFLVAGKRTPFGKFGGSLMDITPVELGVIASNAVLAETGVDPKKIDHVIFANVVPTTTDTIYASRHIALKIGAKVETPAYNVNRLCGSGLQAIIDAANYIRRAEADCVLAAGAENMSMIPHLVYGSRFGTRFGPLQTVDLLMDSLTDKHSGTPMGITAENLAEDFKISRDECNRFSKQSHDRADAAYRNNLLTGEIVEIPGKKKATTKDEQIREGVTLEEMEKLKPSFKKDGTVTAGTASGIVDGAASVLVASEGFCQKNNLIPLAEIGHSTVIGVDPTRMGIGPSPAIKMLLKKIGATINDIDLVEINEAFAAQTLACLKDLSLDQSKVNIWGGAIAIGHPLGASGVRISLTLARQLKHTKGKMGIASACIGGGQGIALQLKAV